MIKKNENILYFFSFLSLFKKQCDMVEEYGEQMDLESRLFSVMTFPHSNTCFYFEKPEPEAARM